MKRIEDMSEDERAWFRDLMSVARVEMEKLPEDIHPAEKIAMMCLVIKTSGRTVNNIRVEYEVDGDLFVTDAIVQLRQAVQNMLALAIKSEIPERFKDIAARTASGQLNLLEGPEFRSLVVELFEKFFELARRETGT